MVYFTLGAYNEKLGCGVRQEKLFSIVENRQFKLKSIKKKISKLKFYIPKTKKGQKTRSTKIIKGIGALYGYWADVKLIGAEWSCPYVV